jgi:hypothetical protein
MDTKAIEQNQLIGYWAKSRGITLKALQHHKNIDDVILLINFKDAFNTHMDSKQKQVWGGIWSSVYTKKKKISKNALNKLSHIGTQIQSRQNKIKSLRQRHSRDLPSIKPTA